MIWALSIMTLLLGLVFCALLRSIYELIELKHELLKLKHELIELKPVIARIEKKEFPVASPCNFPPGSGIPLCAIRESEEKSKDEKTFIRQAPRWVDKPGSQEDET